MFEYSHDKTAFVIFASKPNRILCVRLNHILSNYINNNCLRGRDGFVYIGQKTSPDICSRRSIYTIHSSHLLKEH